MSSPVPRAASRSSKVLRLTPETERSAARYAAPLSLALLGAGLALAGTVSAVDAIVPWVFGIVDSIDWVDVWRPVYNPEPMDTYAYRPLSVVILKLARAVFGDATVVMTALHGLILAAFGLSARTALLRTGFSPRVAWLAAASSLLMPSLLFSGWILVEFDLLGAVFVLNAIRYLPGRGDSSPEVPGAPRLFWTFAVLALLTKETSALQLLAWLAADTAIQRFERRSLRRLLGYVAVLVLATSPMHFVPAGGNVSAFTLFSDAFHPIRILAILLHTTCQVGYLVAPAGVLVLCASGLRSLRVPMLPVLLLALTLGLIAFSPVVRMYSHFEAIIFSSAAMSGLLSVGVLVGLVLLVIPGRSQGIPAPGSAERVWVLTTLFTIAGYALAPVLLRFARADVSARIFAACVPLLHALVWRELQCLWKDRAAGRVTSGLLGSTFALFVLGAGFNAIVFHRTRLTVEDATKSRLALDIRMPCPAIVATNAVQLATVEELVVRGARLDRCAWVETTTAQPTGLETLAEFAGRGGISVDPGQDAYLVVQTARSRMSPAVAPVLAGDFGWTHDFLPEGDDDLFMAYQRLIYEVETDIETLFHREGRLVSRAQLDYVQVPLFWTELVTRLRMGVPVLERYDYVSSAYRIDARQPGFVPNGGRARRDHAPRE